MNKVFSWKEFVKDGLNTADSYNEFKSWVIPRDWVSECEGKTKAWIEANTNYWICEDWLVDAPIIDWNEVPNGAPIKVSCPSYPHNFETTFVGMDEGFVVVYVPEWLDMDWCYDAFDPKWCEVLDD